MKKATKKSARRTTAKKSSPRKVAPEKILQPEIVDEVVPDIDVTPEASSERALVPSDPLTQYLNEIRRYPLLSKEDEHKLAVRFYETKDPKAAEALVTSNLRFVVKIAAEYTRFGAKLIDLVQEGNVGLMHAVKEFNPYKGVRLITYAVWWIRGYIQEYLMRQYSMVRVGTTATQRKLFYQLQRQKEELDRLGPDAAVKQLSGRLGVDPSEVQMMQQRLSGRDVSLDKPLSEDSPEATLLNLQATPSEELADVQLGHFEELSHLKESIAKLRPQLSEKELAILDQRLLADEPATLQEIGDRYAITREAVRQIEQRLIEKLKREYAPT